MRKRSDTISRFRSSVVAALPHVATSFYMSVWVKRRWEKARVGTLRNWPQQWQRGDRWQRGDKHRSKSRRADTETNTTLTFGFSQQMCVIKHFGFSDLREAI